MSNLICARMTSRELLEHIADLTLENNELAKIIREQQSTTEQMLKHVHDVLHQQEKKYMATYADIKAKIDALMESVTASAQVTTSVETYVAGINAQLVEVRAQLADLIATGASSAQLTELDNSLGVIEEATDAEAARLAIIANTPLDPNTPPAPVDDPVVE